jgi:hypothetical protein
MQTEPCTSRRLTEFTAAQIPGGPFEGCPARAERHQAEESALEVFVAHQDLATGVRAKQTLDRLCRQLKPAHFLHLHLWRFELLEDSILWREAVRNASRADILFFSLHGNQPIPSGLCHWFKHWLLLRDERPCALVVSLDNSERDSESGRNALACLRTLAATDGIEVFPYFDAAPVESGFSADDNSPRHDSQGLIGAGNSVVPAAKEFLRRQKSARTDVDSVPFVATADLDSASRAWDPND